MSYAQFALRKVIQILESVNFLLKESEVLSFRILEFEIQVKESAIPLLIRLCVNQRFTDMESGIQYLQSEIHSEESRIHDCLGQHYMGRTVTRGSSQST